MLTYPSLQRFLGVSDKSLQPGGGEGPHSGDEVQ